jgi:hypothetical protein
MWRGLGNQFGGLAFASRTWRVSGGIELDEFHAPWAGYAGGELKANEFNASLRAAQSYTREGEESDGEFIANN